MVKLLIIVLIIYVKVSWKMTVVWEVQFLMKG